MSCQEQADEISALLGEKLGVRGRDLDSRLRRAGRLLPRHVRRQAEVIVQARAMQASPKLARLVDEAALGRAFRICHDHLSAIDPRERRRARFLDILTVNAFNLVVIAGLVIAVLSWRDLI